MNEPIVTKLRDVDCTELRFEESEAVIYRKCVTHANRQTTAAVVAQEVRSGRFTSSPAIVKLWSFRSRSMSRVSDRHSAKTFVLDQDEYLDHGRHGDHDDDRQTSTSDAVSTASTNRRAMSDGGVLLFDLTQLCEESSSSSRDSGASRSTATTRRHAMPDTA